MKKISLTVFLTTVIMTGSLAAQTPAETVAAFHQAIALGDTAEALGYLDPAVIIFESGGAEMSRDEFQSHHLGADMAFAAATNREVTASGSVIEGDMAMVLNRTRATGTFREREIDSNGTETVVLQKQGDDWRIVHLHWSSRQARN